MELVKELAERNAHSDGPFLIGRDLQVRFEELVNGNTVDLGDVREGDVVALIGDFDALSLATLLRLIDTRVIVVPLTKDSQVDHEYFFEAAGVDVIVELGSARRRSAARRADPFLEELRALDRPGLVLFSSGTSGRPKAILHDLTSFLRRFRTPRPTLRTLNFLLFDHIGGINTFFHTVFNAGLVVVPSGRDPQSVIEDIEKHRIELLPATPTFLRLMLLDDSFDVRKLESLKIVTYGTERMDQSTLERLCEALPHADFRQTYGMSELGIMRVRSRARNSLWMSVGGEGIETRVRDGVLEVRSANRMMGYLNAPSPFDADGWYDTGDLVECDGGYVKIVGRSKQIINLGGFKIVPTEIERVALLHPDVCLARARGVPNPITGQHIEVVCQPRIGAQLTRLALRDHFCQHLPQHFVPQSIRIGEVGISHRFKQA